MDGHDGQGGPVRWGGRIGEWERQRGLGGTEISVRRIGATAFYPWRSKTRVWIRRWPFIAVGGALLVGLAIGLRSERC